ncbi:PKD-like family lipoprotein [Butyricimonas muris]|uniref:PKD-like family lipoprotein n=1 Tax=Butyricimonas muris TaxID=3378067 RepID=UPI003967191E
MKKKISYILTLWVLVVFASSCYEDKGNYDYVEISEVTTTGLEESYSKIAFQDVLHIEPTVTSDRAGDEFEYLWTLNLTKGSGTTSDIIELKLDTIGYERVLDFPVNLKQGYYDLILRITNKGNGVDVYHVMSLSVITTFSEGFYLLKDMGNSTDIDLHTWDNSKITDILQKKDGEALPASPVSLGIDPLYCFLDESTGEYVITKALTICTDNDVRIMNIEDMSTIYTHNTMFHNGEVPEEKPYYVWRNVNGVGYISDQGAYFSAQLATQQLLGTGKFGFPAMVDEEDSKPNKNGSVSTGAYYFYFDELKDRFLCLDYNGGLKALANKPKDSEEEAKYVPNGIKHKLKAFVRNYVGNVDAGFALFEDADVAGKHYLYSMALDYDDNPTTYNPIKKVTEIASDSKLNTATLYASNELTAKVIYFVNSNKLYMYDTELNTEEELQLQDFAIGEEITYVSNRYWTWTDDKEHNFDYLVIATHKTGKYKVYLYEVLGGKAYGKPKYVFEGDGKVVKMQYVSPKMSDKTLNYFPRSF